MADRQKYAVIARRRKDTENTPEPFVTTGFLVSGKEGSLEPIFGYVDTGYFIQFICYFFFKRKFLMRITSIKSKRHLDVLKAVL